MKKFLLPFLYWFLFAMLTLWSAGIVYYCLSGGEWRIFIYLILMGAAIWFHKRQKIKWSAWGLLLVLNIVYFLISATNDRPWLASWSKLPEGTIEGDTLTLKNVRHFRYRTVEDFDVRYETNTYDLSKLDTLDFGVCHWDGMEAIAHTMLSFGFRDGQYLALSAETRLAEGDIQGSLPGLYKRFGFQFIFAREEDIFALRSNYRHEDLYLYRVLLPKEDIRLILEDFVRRANNLNTKPEFYNTLTHNCTTALIPSVKKGVPVAHYNPDVLINGFIDKRMFQKNSLLHKEGENFEELKKRSLIPYDFSADDLSRYSRGIREHIGITAPAAQ